MLRNCFLLVTLIVLSYTYKYFQFLIFLIWILTFQNFLNWIYWVVVLLRVFANQLWSCNENEKPFDAFKSYFPSIKKSLRDRKLEIRNEVFYYFFIKRSNFLSEQTELKYKALSSWNSRVVYIFFVSHDTDKMK